MDTMIDIHGVFSVTLIPVTIVYSTLTIVELPGEHWNIAAIACWNIYLSISEYIAPIKCGCYQAFGEAKMLWQNLRKQQVIWGIKVFDPNYPSIAADLTSHAEALRRLLRQHPKLDKGRRVFITHSMGGLVVRKLYEERDRLDPEIDAAMMLFPPHQGAWKAEAWHNRWWYQLVMGPAGQELHGDIAARLPQPDCKVFIIAGALPEKKDSAFIPGDDDGTVAVQRTMLPTMNEHVVLPVGHTYGMNDAAVLNQIAAWLHKLPDLDNLRAISNSSRRSGGAPTRSCAFRINRFLDAATLD